MSDACSWMSGRGKGCGLGVWAVILCLGGLGLGGCGEAADEGEAKEYEGMVWIAGGEFLMGSEEEAARADEGPVHAVVVSGFWMDAREVSNDQFGKFVGETGYVTVAERVPTMQEIMKDLPAGTPEPDASVLVPGSLVFQAPGAGQVADGAWTWWKWTEGANWRHPGGPGSGIEGKGAHPVVHVAFEDAMAYCKWAGKELPTEAQWEFAARGGTRTTYPGGDQWTAALAKSINIWQGDFPRTNDLTDGYSDTAPAGSFEANGYGLFDMAGNVWEWCSDWYRPDSYRARSAAGVIRDPRGPANSLDPDEPTIPKRVTRGGSFLCSAVFCTGYRASARMKTAVDTGLCHTGFRCVVNTRPNR